jgi:hypothetical protein
MPGIFINCRRDDAPGAAGRLYDHLAKSFSRRGSGYLYRAGGNILRYDIDEKSKKITDIVQILDRQ